MSAHHVQWLWHPLPHLDAVQGLTFGELIVNAAIYGAVLAVVLFVLVLPALIRTAVRDTKQEREATARGDLSDPPPTVPPRAE